MSSNWSCGMVPVANDDATFNNEDGTITGNVSTSSKIVVGVNASMVMKASVTLDCKKLATDGPVTNSGSVEFNGLHPKGYVLTIHSDGSFINIGTLALTMTNEMEQG